MQALIEYVYDTLAQDTDLQDIMDGTVRLRLTWADRDEVFPYIVQAYDYTLRPPWGVCEGSWTFDIFDHDPNTGTMERTLDIRDQVVLLLERNFYPTITGFKAVRFWLDRERPLHEREAKIWRLQLTFGFRAVSEKDIDAVLAR
jgi:hypothetical protein